MPPKATQVTPRQRSAQRPAAGGSERDGARPRATAREGDCEDGEEDEEEGERFGGAEVDDAPVDREHGGDDDQRRPGDERAEDEERARARHDGDDGASQAIEREPGERGERHGDDGDHGRGQRRVALGGHGHGDGAVVPEHDGADEAERAGGRDDAGGDAAVVGVVAARSVEEAARGGADIEGGRQATADERDTEGDKGGEGAVEAERRDRSPPEGAGADRLAGADGGDHEVDERGHECGGDRRGEGERERGTEGARRHLSPLQ